MCGLLKKLLGICFVGLGLGILLVLLLPLKGWLFIIGIAIASIGVMWLIC
ncbi:MAG: hypothetical protein IJH39_10530 [Clostridia bacterium]|nr:hypothetical protein [Clostridia bacterium]